jgi:ferredoxin
MTAQPGHTETRREARTEPRTQNEPGTGVSALADTRPRPRARPQGSPQGSPQGGIVHADRDRCCGSGLCVLRLPEVFDQDDDGIVVLLNPGPPEHLRAEVAKAVDACPSGALTLDNA